MLVSALFLTVSRVQIGLKVFVLSYAGFANHKVFHSECKRQIGVEMPSASSNLNHTFSA